jgi:hypothetical protein
MGNIQQSLFQIQNTKVSTKDKLCCFLEKNDNRRVDNDKYSQDLYYM